MTERLPLIAGNWKMNLDHLQATHLVQKVDWVLRDASQASSSTHTARLARYTSTRPGT